MLERLKNLFSRPAPAPSAFRCFSCQSATFKNIECHEDAWYSFDCAGCNRRYSSPSHPDRLTRG